MTSYPSLGRPMRKNGKSYANLAAMGQNSRHHIALLAPLNSVGAEIGVSTGQLSERFLKLNHFSVFHSVDKWDDQAHSFAQYEGVKEKLKKYNESCVWRLTAQDFAEHIADGSLGFIYIDCYAHTGQDDGEVLRCMWPKLQAGGLFSGDDYDKRQWPKTYAAVNAFAASVGKTVMVKDDHIPNAKLATDRHASWYFYK